MLCIAKIATTNETKMTVKIGTGSGSSGSVLAQTAAGLPCVCIDNLVHHVGEYTASPPILKPDSDVLSSSPD